MSERRRHKRKRTNARAMVKSRWHVVDAACLDASPGGFMIRAGQEFLLNEDVEVALELSDGTKVHFNGRVVRQDKRLTEDWQGRGYGVKILDIDAETARRLHEWLASKDTQTGPVPRPVVAAATAQAATTRAGKSAGATAPVRAPYRGRRKAGSAPAAAVPKPAAAVAPAAKPAAAKPAAVRAKPAVPTAAKPARPGAGKRMDPLELQRVLLRLKKKRS